MSEDLYLPYLRRHFSDATLHLDSIVQALWSNYGHIARIRGEEGKSIIVKFVDVASMPEHPRGWSGETSHARKLSSYRNEQNFYQYCAGALNAQYSDEGNGSMVPEHLLSDQADGHFTLVLSDLDGAGLHVRRSELDEKEVVLCIDWLARFHAFFLQCDDEHLWRQGTYWHLSTRQDELAAMPSSSPLKKAAEEIDRKLRDARYHTILHGDAKVANFCFDPLFTRTAAVDFQYCGRGVGVVDLMYLLGSCLHEQQLAHHYPSLVDHYFRSLRLHSTLSTEEFGKLEKEWRDLLVFAWADFERFLVGWAPGGHRKLHGFSQQQTQLALSQIFAG